VRRLHVLSGEFENIFNRGANPLEDGAKLEARADEGGVSLSAYIASVMKERDEDRKVYNMV